jgi:hypothetical protein
VVNRENRAWLVDDQGTTREARTNKDLRREAFSMWMYVSIVLLSAPTVFDDAHPPSERDVLLLEVGTTVGCFEWR